jgi:xylan 1,4-beta-xylosidase
MRSTIHAHIPFVVAAIFLISIGTLLSPSRAMSADDSFAVVLRVDAAKTNGELRPIWRFFGADEPNYAYMKDGKKLLAELGELSPKKVYFRTHNLLTTGDGTPALKWGSTNVYTEDEQGKPVYDWKIVDRIFEAYLERGVKPYVQLGFMPKALSIKPDPYQHKWTPSAKYNDIYTGWAYPPRDYERWGELAYQLTKHFVAKFGKAEVETWYWEVWNEPNIGYWRGTPDEFYKLHDFAINGVRRALPTAKVGGPDCAGSGGKFLRDFLEHCQSGKNYATGERGTPIDFVSFHAKGAPKFVDSHVEMGIANQLRTIDAGFALIAGFPALKNTPIVIGESDPDGCAACQGPQLGYRNTTMFSSYTAACFARKHDLAAKHGVNLEGALTWAFEFEDQSYFAGFRALASNGIDLPVINVFRMFGKMGTQRLAVESDHAVTLDKIIKDGVRGQPDVAALASLDKNRLCVLVWHYHDDDVAGPAAAVDLALTGLPVQTGEARLTHYRIDHDHSNAFTAWQGMGSPPQPSAEQYAQIEKAGRLSTLEKPAALRVNDAKLALQFDLPRQAVSLLVLEWGKQ